MDASTLPIHWQQHHIICCLYYLIAASDFIVKEEELRAIDDHFTQLLTRDHPELLMQKKEILTEVADYVQHANDLQKMEAIRFFAKKTKFAYQTYLEVIHSLEQIAQADNFISIEEHSIMYYIRLKFKADKAQPIYS